MFTFVTALVALCALFRSAGAHTWIEQMQAIDSNGSFVGAMGYSRGYVARTEADYNGFSMEYLLPADSTGRLRINASDLLCHPAQRTANQTDGYPALVTTPGSTVALKYLENGHVTLPWDQLGKPAAGGTVFVYGTTDPLDDETLETVMQWDATGTTGDARGSLLAAQNFDDGRCHQINTGNISVLRQAEFPDRDVDQPTSNVEQWCETDVLIPADSDTNKTLTMYWVWQWNTAVGTEYVEEGKDEYYTTCMDVTLYPANSSTAASASAAALAVGGAATALLQQDPQSRAVTDWPARTALDSVATSIAPATAGSTALDAASVVGDDAAVAVAAATTTSSATAALVTDLVSTVVMVTVVETVTVTGGESSRTAAAASSTSSSAVDEAVESLSYTLSYISLPTATARTARRLRRELDGRVEARKRGGARLWRA